MEPERWVTVATFFVHSEALLARMRLESSGLECLLQDENLCRIYAMAAPVLGGIKLQVREEDVTVAKEILQDWPRQPFLVEGPE